tara:strand:- start:4498 stop:5343 length:846 start_codon:yes stop_codon:yes gene_type:complete
MYKKTIKIAAILIATSFLASCGGGNEKETALVEEETVTEEMVITEGDINQVDYILPSPLQIAQLFKNAGLTYVGDLTNSSEKADNYNSKYDQKLNYGVYAADMAYCVMNNQTQESINYLVSLKELSEKLWMTDIMGSMGLSDRLGANVGNEDSLTYIMADLQMQMDDYLDENGMGYTGSIIFTGAWIETMYLAAKVNETEANPKLVSRLSEQAVILGGLIASIKQNDTDNDFADLVTDLEKINGHFTGFNDESVEEFTLSDEAVKALSADLVILRAKIVGA